MGGYQVGQNLLADMFTQYYFCTQTAFKTHRYAMNQQWMPSTWNGTYVSTMPSLVAIIDQSKDMPTINAIARIWRVFVLNRATDYWGPIPYSQIGNYVPGEGVAYDNQKDIYYNMFEELKQATEALKNNITVPYIRGQRPDLWRG